MIVREKCYRVFLLPPLPPLAIVSLTYNWYFLLELFPRSLVQKCFNIRVMLMLIKMPTRNIKHTWCWKSKKKPTYCEPLSIGRFFHRFHSSVLTEDVIFSEKYEDHDQSVDVWMTPRTFNVSPPEINKNVIMWFDIYNYIFLLTMHNQPPYFIRSNLLSTDYRTNWKRDLLG